MSYSWMTPIILWQLADNISIQRLINYFKKITLRGLEKFPKNYLYDKTKSLKKILALYINGSSYKKLLFPLKKC